MIIYDYIVYDEIECDPYSESCFVYCEDDECAEPFFYTILERKAYNLIDYCDHDNTDCDAAYECQLGETECTTTYCDPVFDGDICDTLTEDDMSTLSDFNESES